jgi:hypothetical protein
VKSRFLISLFEIFFIPGCFPLPLASKIPHKNPKVKAKYFLIFDFYQSIPMSNSNIVIARKQQVDAAIWIRILFLGKLNLFRIRDFSSFTHPESSIKDPISHIKHPQGGTISKVLLSPAWQRLPA